MNPIEELKHEHRAIEEALILLETIAQRVQQPGVRQDARELVEFFRLFADTCHHSKEEHVLFPTLETLGVSRQGGPIGVMLSEHDEGRRHIQAMLAALDALETGGRQEAGQFREHAEAYARLLRQHIDKEDNVLFAIAEQRLSEVRKGRLSEAFERIERDVVGEGKHDELHRLLDALGKKYSQNR